MPHNTLTRRLLLGAGALGGPSLLAAPAGANSIELPLPGSPHRRDLTTAFDVAAIVDYLARRHSTD